MRYWLMKSEPSKISVDKLAVMPEKNIAWFGIRNYQTRNFMRNQMCIGDPIFFYHSCCAQPGITGIAEVCKPAYPDATQFDPKSRYYYPKASLQNPRWFNVEIKLIKKTRLICIKELRQYTELTNMRILQQATAYRSHPLIP